jgi:hypothetical protein
MTLDWLLKACIEFYARTDTASTRVKHGPSAAIARKATDDPEDENVRMDPDHKRPWPALDWIRGWWKQQAAAHSQFVRRQLLFLVSDNYFSRQF